MAKDKDEGKADGRKPELIAWHVPERDGAPWQRIGAAWAHNDGKGFNISLELMPVGTGRITLREPKGDADQGEQEA